MQNNSICSCQSRRKFLKGLCVSGGVILLPTLPAWGANSKTPKALVLTCIDYRFIHPLETFLTNQGLDRLYDLTALAGASLALANFPHLADRSAFWDQLDISYKLHHIQKVILFDHQDCGAYEILDPLLSENLDREEQVHTSYMLNAARAIHDRYPDLEVEGYFATLAGDIKSIAIAPL